MKAFKLALIFVIKAKILFLLLCNSLPNFPSLLLLTCSSETLPSDTVNLVIIMCVFSQHKTLKRFQLG